MYERTRNGGLRSRVKSGEMITVNCKSWMKLGLAIVLSGAVNISGTAQTFDSSATGTVKGAYFVRQVLTIPDANTSAILRAVSLIGTMTFDGAGNYSFTGQLMDSQSGNAQAFSTTGGYAVSANGFFQVANPIHNFLFPNSAGSDIEFGAVGALGPVAIVASSTENSNGYNDVSSTARLALWGRWRSSPARRKLQTATMTSLLPYRQVPV